VHLKAVDQGAHALKELSEHKPEQRPDIESELFLREEDALLLQERLQFVFLLADDGGNEFVEGFQHECNE